jgi:oligopeptide transport system substrate-binding protein
MRHTVVGLLLAALVLTLVSAAGLQSSAQGLAKQQVFRMTIREPTSMDPDLAADASIWYVDQIFEGLYKILDDGKIRWLGAKSMDVSKDGLTWTVHLNPAAKWSDKQPVTAHDYEYSWKRAIDPKLSSEVASFYDPVKGAKDYSSGKIKDPSLVAIRAVDDYTLQFTLAEPTPYFRTVLGLTYFYPVPRHIVEKFGDKWTEAGNIVSNGPFKMQGWKHDQEMDLVRDDGYWGTKPALQQIILRIVPAADLCTSDFRAYQADEEELAMCVPTPDIERVLTDPTLKKQLTPEVLSASQFLVFDAGRAPWTNTKVRQAFNLAIDRNKVVQVISRGLYKPTKVLVPPGIQGYGPSHALSGSAADAKRLLAEAGFAAGKGFPEFKISAPDIRGNRTLAELLQQMWKETLGVDAKPDIMEPKAFSAWRSARKDQPFDIYTRGGWWSDYEDPTNWYNIFFEDGWLNSHWRQPDFLRIIGSAKGELNEAKRRQMYESADVILERESPTIGLWYFTDYWMRKPWVQGVQHVRIDGFIWLRDARILAH